MLSGSHALQLVPASSHKGRLAEVRPSLLEFLPLAMAGDAAAIENLVTALLPRARNLVRYLVWRDADVDDLTQEALLVVLDGLPSYRAEGAFEGWVDRIIVRCVFRQLRKLRKEPSRVETSQPYEGADLVAAIPYPDDYLTRRQVVAVLDQLSPEQRYVLVLHHVLDMTVPEIASQLKIPTETVRSRLRLARNNLREQNLATNNS